MKHFRKQFRKHNKLSLKHDILEKHNDILENNISQNITFQKILQHFGKQHFGKHYVSHNTMTFVFPEMFCTMKCVLHLRAIVNPSTAMLLIVSEHT